MLAKFNETMEPLYMLLKEIEDIRLTADLLDPDIDSRVEQTNHVYDGTFSTGKWADKKKGLSQFGHLLSNNNDNFNVKIEDTSSAQAAQSQQKKEQPIWMLESTIAGASNFELNKGKLANGNAQNSASRSIIDTLELPLNGEFGSDQAKEVLEILLSNEKPNELKWSRLSNIFGFKNEDEFDGIPVIKEEPVDSMDWSDGIENVDFFETLPKIQVNGRSVSISKITDHHIESMSDQEKQEYIRTAQPIYSAFFDI